MLGDRTLKSVLNLNNVSSPARLGLMALGGLILLGLLARLLPHPPNFTPLLAIALLCGAVYARPLDAVLVPLGVLLVTDLWLGLHGSLWAVYGSIVLIAALGWRMKRSTASLLVTATGASVLFFALTNFAVWWGSGLYPLTAAGLLACYMAAIPFFINTLGSTVLFALGLFSLARVIAPSTVEQGTLAWRPMS